MLCHQRPHLLEVLEAVGAVQQCPARCPQLLAHALHLLDRRPQLLQPRAHPLQVGLDGRLGSRRGQKAVGMLSEAAGLVHRLPQPCQASPVCISPALEGESCPWYPSCLPISHTMTPSHRLLQRQGCPTSPIRRHRVSFY